jgi:hypothetical protein
LKFNGLQNWKYAISKNDNFWTGGVLFKPGRIEINQNRPEKRTGGDDEEMSDEFFAENSR